MRPRTAKGVMTPRGVWKDLDSGDRAKRDAWAIFTLWRIRPVGSSVNSLHEPLLARMRLAFNVALRWGVGSVCGSCILRQIALWSQFRNQSFFCDQVSGINKFMSAAKAADISNVKGKKSELLTSSQKLFSDLVNEWHTAVTSNISGIGDDYFLKCILDVWIPLVGIRDVHYGHAFPVKCPAYISQLSA